MTEVSSIFSSSLSESITWKMRDEPMAGLIWAMSADVCFPRAQTRGWLTTSVTPVTEDPAFLLSSEICAHCTNPHMDHIYIYLKIIKISLKNHNREFPRMLP